MFEKLIKLEAKYLIQTIYSISQLSALIYAIYKTSKQKTKQLYLLSILLAYSFLQSFMQFYFKTKIYIENTISIYILIEFFVHSTIIESYIENKLLVKYYLILKYLCIGFIFMMIVSNNHYFPNNSWISHIPDSLILVIGIIAINNLIERSPIKLLKSFEFWLIYSFIFIRLSLIPIEAIDHLYLDKLLSESRLIWIKSHQYIYLIYHILIIYSLKWIPKHLI
jgi:hypothetical protein